MLQDNLLKKTDSVSARKSLINISLLSYDNLTFITWLDALKLLRFPSVPDPSDINLC